VRSGSAIVVLLCAAIVTLPASAAAKVTAEDRAFAHAFERYDARARQIVADPALLAALRARQQASAGCVDAARALAQADRGSGERNFEAQFFYTVYANDSFLEPLVRAGRDYGAALRRLHLRERTLRSARAVLLVIDDDVRLPDQAALGDFCGPLRTWQAAGFAQADEPAPIKAVAALLARAQNLTVPRRAIMRRAARRMRAVGMSRAARGNLAMGGQGINLPSMRGDQILAALQA
jgi:hypothetical protein